MKFTYSKTWILIAALSWAFISCGGGASQEQANDEPGEMPAMEADDDASGSLADGTYKVDANDENLTWTGYHLGKSYEHTGTVALKSGQLSVEKGTISGGTFVIDLTKMTNTDIEEDEKKADLIGHLSTEDFFNVGEFPTASFTITSVAPLTDGAGTHSVTGDLSIKGITDKVMFPATISPDGDRLALKADMKFDRSKWDIKYNSKSFFPNLVGDKIISDEINIKFDMMASANM